MVKKIKAPDKRIKRTHKFQLNINRDVELWLHEKVESLTKQRKFSQYVRDGLGLMISFAEWGITAQAVYDLLMDLRAGNLDKLFEMFPHIKAKFQPSEGVQTTGGAGQLEEIKGLLEIIASQQNAGNKHIMQSALTPKVELPAVPAPVVAKAATVSAESLADNFLSFFN